MTGTLMTGTNNLLRHIFEYWSLQWNFAFMEQILERELFFFIYRHHGYKLTLKTVFETKVMQITRSSDIPIFKSSEAIGNIDSNDIKLCLNFLKQDITETNIRSLLMFNKAKGLIRDDYCKLVELYSCFCTKSHRRTEN